MSREPFDVMLNGFSWDIEDRVINSEDDLWLYANNVTGSIVEIVVYAIMYRCDNESYDIVGQRNFIEKIHTVGRVSGRHFDTMLYVYANVFSEIMNRYISFEEYSVEPDVKL